MASEELLYFVSSSVVDWIFLSRMKKKIGHEDEVSDWNSFHSADLFPEGTVPGVFHDGTGVAEAVQCRGGRAVIL